MQLKKEFQSARHLAPGRCVIRNHAQNEIKDGREKKHTPTIKKNEKKREEKYTRVMRITTTTTTNAVFCWCWLLSEYIYISFLIVRLLLISFRTFVCKWKYVNCLGTMKKIRNKKK